jgi:hypothetical protein
MDENYKRPGRVLRRLVQETDVTNDHWYRTQVFYSIIDVVLSELNHRFPSNVTQLLSCASAFDPRGYFKLYKVETLKKLATFYPRDFNQGELAALEDELKNFILIARTDEELRKVEFIGELSKAMVKNGMRETFALVYRLLCLVLLLPVTTATVERSFSAMKIVKDRLRNRMGDQWLYDLLVIYIEKDLSLLVDNEEIIKRFMKMKERRGNI